MKLININVGIKINNSVDVANFLKEQNADIIAVQEIVRHLDEGVYEEFKSKEIIENIIGNTFQHNFFGPLWITDAFRQNGKVHRDFGGMMEQGNEVMSKFPIVEATNEHYYKSYSYAHDWSNWKTEDHGRSLQVVELNINGSPLQILNIHGIWTEDKKGDDRTIQQCRYVVSAAKRKKIPTIISGDFNLLPETDSINIINNEFRNLISEYGIKSTRPDFNDGTDQGKNVVDYIFVSDGIKVNDFQVIETNVSDHLPLTLDFEIS